jgi:hypothetical protein
MSPAGKRNRPAEGGAALDDERGPGDNVSTKVPRRADGRTAALYYASRGWPVFPCWPGSKEPATTSGFKDATTEPSLIAWWWDRIPDANVAIATGAPAVDVLDVDVKPDKGVNGYPAFNRLKRAGLLAGGQAIVQTPSGGLHVYFAGTGQRWGSVPKEGIDFKACGGYVLAPPSTVNGRRYEFVDRRDSTGTLDWTAVKGFLRPPPPRRTTPRVALADTAQLPRWLVSRLADTNVPDRSAYFHGLVGSCIFAGLSLDRTIDALRPWCEATGKFTGRVEAETARSWQKIGGAA